MRAPAGATDAATERELIVGGVPNSNGFVRTLVPGEKRKADTAANGDEALDIQRRDRPEPVYLDRSRSEITDSNGFAATWPRSLIEAVGPAAGLGSVATAAQTRRSGTDDDLATPLFSCYFQVIAGWLPKRIHQTDQLGHVFRPLIHRREALGSVARAEGRDAVGRFGGDRHALALPDELAAGGLGLWRVIRPANRFNRGQQADGATIGTIDEQFES